MFNKVLPQVLSALDPNFQPAVLVNKSFRQSVNDRGNAQLLKIAIERGSGMISTYETLVFPDTDISDMENTNLQSDIISFSEQNMTYVERLVK